MARQKDSQQHTSRAQRHKKDLYWKTDPDWYLWFQEKDDETFKEVPGYEGLYFISNYGRLVSFHFEEPREILPVIKNNLETVPLTIWSKKQEHTVKDLVYLCFEGPIPPDAEIIYRNGNPRDNYIHNLEPVEKEYIPPLQPAAPGKSLTAPGPKRENLVNRKEVLQFDVKGRYLMAYPSAKAAASAADTSLMAIQNCLDKKCNTAGGSQWYRGSDPLFADGIKDVKPVRPPAPKILQFSIVGKYVRKYNSANEAAKNTGLPAADIAGNLKGKRTEAGGFQFFYDSDPRFRFGIRDIAPLDPKRGAHPNAVAVLQFDFGGRFVAEHASLQVAGDAVGRHPSDISTCLRKIINSSGGFQWRYRDDPRFEDGITDIDPLENLGGHQRTAVVQFDLDGKFVKQFPNTTEAGQSVGVASRSINNAIQGITRSCRGFQWRYTSDPRFSGGITDIAPLKKRVKGTAKAVLKFDRNHNPVAEYPSLSAAAAANGVVLTTIKNHMKGRAPKNIEFYYQFKETNKEGKN